jgi:putative membrane-bound dehydrogenase-like protein
MALSRSYPARGTLVGVMLSGLLLAASRSAEALEPAAAAATRDLVQFETRRLDNRFFSEGASVGDLDGDGQPDLICGPLWYRGPDFSTSRELYEPKPFDPHGYSDCFFQFVHDIDRDGDADVVVYGFPGQQGWWLENPGHANVGTAGHWTRHLALDVIDNESPQWVDLTGDGVPEIVCSVGGCFGYASIPADDPHGRWSFTRVTPEVGAAKFTHGLGVGDVDGDGRLDLLEKSGWWRQPESLEGSPLWERHAFEFSGPGGAQMHVRDVDGDGLNDVITSLAAHGWGLVWYRQVIGDDGSRSFEQQTITGEKPSDSPFRVAFSQIHAIDMADIDGDGLDDIITGKRYWAHGPKGDPEPDAPAVVYWFRCVRSTDPATGTTTAEFVPQLVDDASGVGVEVKAVDASGDGLPDIVVGNKQGAFVHVQSRQPVSAEVYAASQPRRRRPMVNGLPPAEAAEAMTVPPGFTVKMLAAEPDVRQPIAMAFDDRGRLWVAEAYSYPVRLPDEEARDRILIFEDTDGDDVFDSRKVFIEGLNLVSGLEVGFGGVWVGAAPYLLFIPDADGDDVPDGKPVVLLDGWAWQDTHETLNAFTWGPDGWLYGCHGVFTHSNVGKPGTPDERRTRLNAAIWRYHPTKHAFEIFAEGTSNPWGVDFNDVGDAFETACVIPHLYHMIQNARYQRQAGQHFNPWSFDDIKTIARHRHWTGGQWNQADREKSDAIGGGHAHSGAMVYLGGAWPDRYRGQLFMNNIHGARLNVDRLEPAGSGYVGDGEPDFLFANDTWSQIIALQYGPDGQVTFIDWYDANQCHHNEVEKHDRENGRIFKVAYVGSDGGTITGPADVAACPDAELVGLLAHDNDWYVRHARRLLQERSAAGSLEAATPRLLAAQLAQAESHEKRLRVLWAMHVTGCLDEAALLRLLDDESPHVRGWAVQLACERLSPEGTASLAPSLAEALVRLAASDPSPVVRRFLASAAGRMPLADRWSILERLVAHAEDADDHNLPLLEWYAVEPLVPVDPSRALALAAASRIPTVSRFIVRRAAAEEAYADPLIEAMAAADSASRAWMLGEVIAALEARGRAGMPKAWEAGYEALRADEDANVRRMADDVAARFGDPRVRPALRARVIEAGLPLPQRIAALEALVASRDPELPPVLQSLLTSDELSGTAAVDARSALLAKAIGALAVIPHEATPQAILAAYGSLPPDAKQAAIATLTARSPWTLALLDAIEAGRLSRDDLSAFTVGRLAESADEAVLARINEVWGTIRSTPADRQAEFTAWRSRLTDNALADADLSHGREVFAKTCGTCHQLHGVGAKIGPELTGSNRADLEYLLANLLDPSAVVGRDYQMTQVVTTDGRVIGGIVVAETPTSIALQTPTERIVVPLEDIDVRELSTQSLMPENQLTQLEPASAVALVAYLRHPTQVPLPGEGPPPFTAEGSLAPQAMGSFKAGRWSGTSHLWWTGAKPGDAVTLEVPVTASGTYDVFAILTKAPDYATVKLSFHDGQATGSIDLYDARVIQSLPVSLGRFVLEPGTVPLRIEITGANPEAVPAYMAGLDCLYLLPVKDEPVAAVSAASSDVIGRTPRKDTP